MLKRLIAFSLLISILVANCSRFLLYAGYQIKQDYIASVLCINKDQPLKHCNGRCYLMKKLKAVEEKEQKQSREAQKNSYQEAMRHEPFSLALRPATPIKTSYFKHEVARPVSRAYAIFQPPRAA